MGISSILNSKEVGQLSSNSHQSKLKAFSFFAKLFFAIVFFLAKQLFHQYGRNVDEVCLDFSSSIWVGDKWLLDSILNVTAAAVVTKPFAIFLPLLNPKTFAI